MLHKLQCSQCGSRARLPIRTSRSHCISPIARSTRTAASHSHPHQPTPTETQPENTNSQIVGRRQLLSQSLGAILASSVLLQTPASQADSKLPKAYRENVRKIIESLRDTIGAERNGDKETEIRRKADPGRESLQTFVRKWRDDVRVIDHPSHAEIMGVLSVLGRFYSANGPRARMSSEVQEEVLGHLTAAENALLARSEADDDAEGLEGLLPSA